MGWESGKAGGTGEEPDPDESLPGGHSDPTGNTAGGSGSGTASNEDGEGSQPVGELDDTQAPAAIAGGELVDVLA